jgi:hypothetical protein
MIDHWLATSGVSYEQLSSNGEEGSDVELSSEVQEAWNAKPNVGCCPVCRARHLEPEHAVRLRRDCLRHVCKDWLETYNPQEDYDRILANKIQEQEDEERGNIFPFNDYDSDNLSDVAQDGDDGEYMPNPFEDWDSEEEARQEATRVEEDILNNGFIVSSDDDTFDF